MQRILVTGGAGFIGSHSVDMLLANHKEVVVLDNLSSGKLTNLDLTHPKLTFIEGDVLEYPLIETLLVNCDAVLHLAAVASVHQSLVDPVYTLQVNTQGFLHVLHAIHKTARPIRLVYASSAAVYGDTTALPCQESAVIDNALLSPYALQKKHMENYAALYTKLYGTSALGLRYFNVYGERQDPQSFYSGVISRFLAAFTQNRSCLIFGDGQQSRDFISVKDIARANLLALNSDAVGVLNIATGQPQTLLQLIDFIEKSGQKPLTRQFEPARLGDIYTSFAATQQAEDVLGFRAGVPLEAGIGDLVRLLA